MSDPLKQLALLAARHGLTGEARAELEALLRESISLPPDSPDQPEGGIGRYAQGTVLGLGGMGEVFRVFDPILERHVALKLLRADRAADPAIHRRFIDEARLTAQLEHPGIVSVYTLEQTRDGRTLFTMPEFKGQTLRAIIRQQHPGARPAAIRRLLVSFLRACQAVAYAHDRGVIHHDIKPSNIMFGGFGEVLVLDWGMAVRQDTPMSRHTAAGTPRYMSRAQATLAPPSPADDVYALGAVMIELITGIPPFPGVAGREILGLLQSGARISIPPLPPGLTDLAGICHAAVAPTAVRPPNAGALAALLSAWLDGSQARDRARGLIDQADALHPSIEATRAHAEALERQAAELRREVPLYAPIPDKRPIWALEDEAERSRREAEQIQDRYIRLLQAALRESPMLDEADRRLADHYQREHAAAEERGEHAAAERLEQRLRAHDRGAHAAWLVGDGRLTLHTDPPGASVTLLRYTEQDRRLVAIPEADLGQTPIIGRRLSRGRYLLHIEAPGHEPVRYPVLIERSGHWDGIAPGESAPTPVPLPPLGMLAVDDCYIPPGWFIFGGDPHAQLPRPARRIWLDGLIIKRFPVTNREYLRFISDLDAPLGERWAPRERPGPHGDPGPLLVGRDAQGCFILVEDADGDIWTDEMPVTYIDWAAASAYAAWYARRTGQPWRLPWELEWEKAARGVDRRLYPWGDHADPTWCQCRDSGPGRQIPSSVHSFPVDESPYGVRGMAGNVMDWCLDPWLNDGPPIRDGRGVAPPASDEPRRMMRGGYWFRDTSHARVCGRTSMIATGRDGGRGFRLARPWPR